MEVGTYGRYGGDVEERWHFHDGERGRERTRRTRDLMSPVNT